MWSAPDETSPTWQIRTLAEATRRIFDSVADGLHELVLDDTQRPQLGRLRSKQWQPEP